MISPNQLVNRLTPDIRNVEGFQPIHNQNNYEHISQLDVATMAFAHKLGVVVESEYTLKISVTTNQRGSEDVYFIVPMEVDDE
jgi:hypothetical protein